MFNNPFELAGTWHKANLHTHTTVSDGRVSAAERVEQYRDAGYSVLAITDHSSISNAAAQTTPEFLVIDGIEVSLGGHDDMPLYHLVCLNVSPDATVPAARKPNDVIAWAKEEGGESLIAHPYWSGNNAQDLLSVRGIIGIEVYNASCLDIGKAVSSVHWDNVLDRGLRMPGAAVDDTHSADRGLDVFGGWTMLKLNELSAGAVLEALRTGCYYSSSGAEVRDFRISNGVARIRCSEAREVHLIGANWHGHSFYADEASPLTDAQAEVDDEWKYVRAEVVGMGGRRAWTNPIYL